jgi:alkylation response protein AidB-like acyl-CoA dehydrogenase
MNFDLEHEHQLLRDTVRSFALEKVAPVAEELDREHRFPYEIVAELAELGLMGMTIPEEYGGAGTDTLSYAIAVEELTRIDSSVAITVAAHHSLGTLPIYYFGSEEQKREWLPDLASGRTPARTPVRRARPRSSTGASGSSTARRCSSPTPAPTSVRA